MDIKTKLAVLTILYSIYEDFVSSFTLACEKHCALCCTRGVTLTTIEGYMILDHLVSKGKSDSGRGVCRTLPPLFFRKVFKRKWLMKIVMGV
jgi:hypothetical protein